MMLEALNSLGVNTHTFDQGGAVMWPLLGLAIGMLYSWLVSIMPGRQLPQTDSKCSGLADEITRLWTIHDYRARLEWLKLLTFIAPLLGLLGTVTGMVEVFSTMATSGQFSPSMISSGISKAMITTQTGLILGLFGAVCVFNMHKRLQSATGANS